MNFYYYDYLLEEQTKHLDPRIKDIDLYEKSRVDYVNQRKNYCDFSVFNPNMITFLQSKKKKDCCDVERKVVQKNVIFTIEDHVLTYSETREFNRKHFITNLQIQMEFLYGEKIQIQAEKKDYGVLFSSTHQKYIDFDYSDYAKLPTVGVPDFYMLPFGDVFYGCEPETVSLFEECYSGILYPEQLKKSR